MEKFVCRHPWSHFEVNNPNGDVTMCCNNNTVLGNVNENTIGEIWNGEDFRRMRQRMIDEGAHAFCPHTCPVLKGGKKYENLDWFGDLSEDGDPYRNAVINEREFAERSIVLDSTPRWLRFTYSYACNLDCYHCYQREDAKIRQKLPARFMEEVRNYAFRSQVVFPFGGEPFYFGPVLDFLESHDSNLENRFYFITNATILTDRVFEILHRLPISCMAVSLDAATAESFETLRVRGRNADWETVLANLQRLTELKRWKDFTFTISMTLNSVNCEEIDTFVDLALSYEAEPLVVLVSNPFQTYDFQKKFLQFSEPQFASMHEQIERGLEKVRARGFEDAENCLVHLRMMLRQHRDYDNRSVGFLSKKFARQAYHRLPEQLQIPIRKAVQKARVRKFEQYAEPDDQ